MPSRYDPTQIEPFSHVITIGDEDIDGLGHASNIAYVRWIQDVAVAHSSAVGLTFDAYMTLGGVFVVRRHEVDYLRPVLRGDRLELRTWIGSIQAAKCARLTEITKIGAGDTARDGAPSSPHVVARACTTWGYIEMATGRPTRIPLSVREAFGLVTSPPSQGSETQT